VPRGGRDRQIRSARREIDRERRQIAVGARDLDTLDAI
jgi:hypothetical protein